MLTIVELLTRLKDYNYCCKESQLSEKQYSAIRPIKDLHETLYDDTVYI